MSIAWLFPGQGSQKIGMAQDVIDLPEAKSRFALASEILGRDLLAICSDHETVKGEIFDLNDTRNTQPALFLIESILADDMKRQGREPSFLAGHSLGEMVALYVGEVIDFETALRLIKKRSELMAGTSNGSMTAIIGFDREQLEEVVNLTDGVVIANDNSANQVVISGDKKAVQIVSEKVSCKRVIPLNVSGAFHSPLMEEASNVFSMELSQVEFSDAKTPILSNADPSPTTSGSLIKDKLLMQMTNGVRWRETMDCLLDKKVETIVEIGPGNVLSGLAKRSMKGVGVNQISSLSDLGH